MTSPRIVALALALTLWLLPAIAVANQVCEGRVFVDQNHNGLLDSEESGLPGAIVFFETGSPTITDSNGHYTMSVPEGGGIIWVRGQDGLDPGPFWALVEPGTGATIDLPVRPATGSGEFSFIAASDTHAGIGLMSPEDQIIGMVQAAGVLPKPFFVTVTGDITAGNAPTHFESVFAAIDAIDIPYVPVPGNHDWYDGGANYRLYFGPPTYAFDAGGVHFVVLNDASSLANRLAFLDLDRSYVVDQRPIVVLMHAPPRENLRLALDQRDIDVLLTGHMHSNRVLMHDSFVEYNTQPLVMGGMDLSPAGFRIFSFASDGSMTVDHRTTVNTSIVRIVAPAEDQSFAPCTARLIVALEPGSAITEIRASVDGLGDVELTKSGGWNYQSPLLETLCEPNRYLAIIDVTSASGTSFSASATIVIRPTARAPVIADWPMFQGNAQHTGSTLGRIDFPLRTEWVATVGSNIHGGSPVVANGRVFVSVSDFGSGLLGGVVALDARTGETLWEHRVGFSVRNAPAVVDDTLVFVSNDGTIHALDVVTGEGQWTYELAPQMPSVQRNLYSSPTIADGIVYAGGRHEFVAIDPKAGSTLWRVEPFDDYGDLSSHASPTISGDTVMVPFNRRGGLFAYDRHIGTQLWTAGPGIVQAIHGSPVVDGDVVYVVNELARLTAVGILDGQEKWGLTLEAGAFYWGFLAESTPVLQGTTLLVGTQRGGLYAVDTANQEVRWSFEADTSLIRATHYHGETGAITAAPVITGDYVWVPGQDGWLRVLDLVTGKELWSTDLGVPIASSPAIAGDLLVVASYDGSVRGLRHPPVEATAPPSPQREEDALPEPAPEPREFGVGGGASCGCQSGKGGRGGVTTMLLTLACLVIGRRRSATRRAASATNASRHRRRCGPQISHSHLH